jgi:hypothetical protein
MSAFFQAAAADQPEPGTRLVVDLAFVVARPQPRAMSTICYTTSPSEKVLGIAGFVLCRVGSTTLELGTTVQLPQNTYMHEGAECLCFLACGLARFK